MSLRLCLLDAWKEWQEKHGHVHIYNMHIHPHIEIVTSYEIPWISDIVLKLLVSSQDTLTMHLQGCKEMLSEKAPTNWNTSCLTSNIKFWSWSQKPV